MRVLTFIPVGIIYSTTNIEITLNVIAEFFGGIWFEGNALGVRTFLGWVVHLLTPRSDELLQVVWLRHHSTCNHVCAGSQACPLHAHPTTCDVLVTDGRDLCVDLCDGWHYELPDEHTGRLRPAEQTALLLPRAQHLLHCIRSLGYSRPDQDVWRKGHVQRSRMVLPHWCRTPGHLSLRQEARAISAGRMYSLLPH